MNTFRETQANLMDLETAIEFYNQYNNVTVCNNGKPTGYYDEKKEV